MLEHRPPALFLHSAFRSGSTWFWNRFRQTASACAYYEPFNEGLAGLTPDKIAHGVPGNWATGHPTLSAPYFTEYRSLLRPEGGVASFEPRFSYEDYFNDEPDEGSLRYIAALTENAWQAGKIPVLGFCRSLVRVPWFHRHCPGVHIVTWRNPWDQWASCHDQSILNKNAYFEFKTFLISSIGNLSKKYRDYFCDLYLPPFLKYSPVSNEEFLYKFFYATHVNHRFRIFLRLFMLDMLSALAHADEVVDLDRLSADADYRRETTLHLRSVSGLADLSFDDCALPRHAYQEDGDYLAEMDAALVFLDDVNARLSLAEPEVRALSDLKDRMRRCRQDMCLAASLVVGAGDDQADEPDGGLDRYTLSHILFAVQCMLRDGGEPASGLDYLRSVYGPDYPVLLGDLAQVADFVHWLDGDPAHAKERAAAARLSQALSHEEA
jgi:hypothetical protein